MNWKHLFWIIPVTIIVSMILAFFFGASYTWNMMAEKCNAQYEVANALCDIECSMNEGALNMWEYYEKRCPDVYIELQSGKLDLYEEWEKYGINSSSED